jgi:hypothetical protein
VKINKILVNIHKILLKFTKIRMDFQLTKFFGEFYMIFFLSVDLDALSEWLKFNKLKLNVSKTKFMIITGKRSSATERAFLL